MKQLVKATHPQYQLRVLRISLLAATATLAVILTAGCGGGAGSTVEASRAAGKLALTVKWPAPGRLIPAASNSIVAAVLDSSGKAVATQILARPQTAPWTTTVVFNDISLPQVILSATAYPSTSGTGVAQATGASPVTITPGQQASVTVTMISTIDHITLTPPNQSVDDGSAIHLTATAYDINNNVVLITPGKLNWTSSATNFATVDNSGNVTGVGEGATLISAQEMESGKTGTETVNAILVPPSIGPNHTAVSPDGNFLFVSRALTKDIKTFSIGSTGALTPASVSLAHLGQYPFSMYITTNAAGSYLYVLAADSTQASVNTNTAVYQFAIQSNGSLTPLTPATVAVNESPGGLVGDSAGKYLFEIDENAIIRCFTIGATGALKQNGSDYKFDGSFQLSGVAGITASNTFMYLGVGGGGIQDITIQPDGTLVAGALTLNYQLSLEGVSSAPTQKVVYFDLGESIAPYTVNNDGSLTADGAATSVPSGSFASVISPDGSHLYTFGASVPTGTVSGFSINSSGALAPTSPASVACGLQPRSIAMSKDGKYIYVANYYYDSISQYSIGSNGALSTLSPATVGS